MSISFKNYIVDFQKDLICENAYLKGLFMSIYVAKMLQEQYKIYQM